MAPLSRLWFVLAGPEPLAVGGLVARLAERPLAAVACAPQARALAQRLVDGRALRTTAHEELGAEGPPALQVIGLLAAQHADDELALVVARAALATALVRALGLEPAGRAALSLRDGALFAFDWPTDAQQGARPLLIGADLDWLPPWTRGRSHAPFPGGPGSAGSARA